VSTSRRALPRRTIGLFVEPLCRHLALAALDLQGQCFSGRIAHIGRAACALPDELREGLAAAIDDQAVPPSQLADLSARLAEFEAEAVHQFLRSGVPSSANAEPLLLAVWEPHVRHAAGRPWQSVLSLGDSVRLAELTGLNVLDGCEARRVAARSDPASMDNVALWILLHSAKRDRVYLEWGDQLRVVLLPAGCEASAAGRVSVRTIEGGAALHSDAASSSDLAWRVVDVLRRFVPQSPNPVQLLVRFQGEDDTPLVEEILRLAPFAEPLDWRHVRVLPDDLDAAVTAAMGLLFLDHLPQAPDATDLTHGPRLLGRLTPGSILNWHRLLEHTAASLPENVPLRAAV